jgi:hypothetical protein
MAGVITAPSKAKSADTGIYQGFVPIVENYLNTFMA